MHIKMPLTHICGVFHYDMTDSISSKFMCAWYTNIIFRSTSSISCHSRQKLRSEIDRKWIFLAYNFRFERTSVLYFDWNVSNWQCMVSNGRFVLVNNRSSSSSSSIVMEMCLDFFTESVNRSESVCVCLLEVYCSMSSCVICDSCECACTFWSFGFGFKIL